MMQSALVGGLFIGVLSALPVVSLGNCCCLWMVGGGFLAAYLEYQNGVTSMPPSRGLWLGACAGVAGAVVWLPASMVLTAVMGPLQERLAGAFASPDMPAGARVWIDALAGPFLYALGFAFQLVIGTGAAAIGGLLGAAWFRKDVPPALGGAPPPITPDLRGLR
jgi:hypothetical protein